MGLLASALLVRNSSLSAFFFDDISAKANTAFAALLPNLVLAYCAGLRSFLSPAVLRSLLVRHRVAASFSVT